MSNGFLDIATTPSVLAAQAANGSAGLYDKVVARRPSNRFGDTEAAFIAARDSFYMASVSEAGWPYVQHRGGPVGFLRRIEGNRIGFADYRGNMQYLSAANLAADDRAALFLMDYPNRRRLKLIGHVHASDDPADITALMVPDYRAVPERAFLIDIVGFDWNCPQHITPRFTEAEIERGTQPLLEELARLRARIEELEGNIHDR